MTSFFTRISDTRCGGTYMTLLKTVRNLGWSFSYTIAILMVDILSFNCYFDDLQNYLNDNLKNVRYFLEVLFFRNVLGIYVKYNILEYLHYACYVIKLVNLVIN